MRAFHLLEAYNREKTLMNFGQEILLAAQNRHDHMSKMYIQGLGDERMRNQYLQHFPGEPGMSAVQRWKAYNIYLMVKHLEDADPTPKKAFVRYLIKWYLDGSMYYLEDAEKATEGLKLYGKFRNRNLPSLGNMDFEGFLDLADELEGYRSQTEESKAEAEEFFRTGQAQLILENDEVRIIMLKSYEASKFFGRGTRWCTAMATTDQYWKQYSEEGPLFVFLFKAGSEMGSANRWQVHPDGGQFMDSKDHALSYHQIQYAAGLLGPKIVNAIPRMAQYMRNPPIDAVLKCIELSPRSFATFGQNIGPEIINQVPREMQLEAVRAMGTRNYIYCSYKDDDAFKWAVVRHANDFGKLNTIHEPTYDMIMTVLEMNGMEIAFVEDGKTDEMVRTASIETPESMSKGMQTFGADYSDWLRHLRYDLVKGNPKCLEHLPPPYEADEELQLLALETHGTKAADYIRAMKGKDCGRNLSTARGRDKDYFDCFYPSVVKKYFELLSRKYPGSDWTRDGVDPSRDNKAA